MKINNNQVIIGCDVDGTLVRRKKLNDLGNENYTGRHLYIVNPYDKQNYGYIAHEAHIELLRQYKGRGFYIIVWSANGVGHAKSVVDALGLGDPADGGDGTVDEVMTKCMKVMDDRKDVEGICGSRVYIPEEGFDVI